MIGAGDLDRIVKLQAATVSNDPNSNEPISTWATYASVYGAMEFHQSAETDASARRYAERGLFFTIRWRSDVLPEHRILFDNEAYEIIGRAREIGRRQFMKLEVRLVE